MVASHLQDARCIEKHSSPTGDGNPSLSVLVFPVLIEKHSSPTGDGNQLSLLHFLFRFKQLRNIVPRQGTETAVANAVSIPPGIEKHSSPTGDGNKWRTYSSGMSDFY